MAEHRSGPADDPGGLPPGDSPGLPGLSVLGREECLALLASVPVGRLAFVVDGWPVVLPVNHRFDGDHLVLRTGEGSAWRALSTPTRVAFEADALDHTYLSGWSVLAHGMAEQVQDATDQFLLGGLLLRPWVPGRRDRWLRVRLLQVTGRRLARAWAYPDPPP